MDTVKFAEVYLLDVPFHADTAYTYAVPDTFETLAPGMLVAVPFGRGNRRRTALVSEVSDRIPEKAGIKPLLEVVSREILLDEEMRRLAFFLKDRTLCTVGDAFRAMVPSAAVSKTREYYTVPEIRDPGETMSPEEQILFDKVARAGKMQKRDLIPQGGEEVAKTVARMVRRGWLIRSEESTRGGTNRKFAVWYSLAVPKETAEQALEEGSWRSRGQKEILRAMAFADRRLSETELFALSRENATSSQIRALIQKGYIREEKEEIYRNPFLHSGVSAGPSALTEEQQDVYGKLCDLSRSGQPQAALLYGITGSGKTAVIRAMIEETLRSGRGVIVLVPEISLTPQTVGIFVGCFGERVAVIHSMLSSGERYDAFRRIREGKADVVIGTRSAVFAPVKNLGLIVIDEEQEHTYKSDTDPKYLTHDVASFRCGEHRALLLLASATPSVTSYRKAMTGVYSLLTLKHRYGNARLPEVRVVDMKQELAAGNATSLSGVLRDALLEARDKRQQSIVFLNRRGYHGFLTCRACGEVILCPKCSVSLTYHAHFAVNRSPEEEYLTSYRRAGVLQCHYCGYRTEVPERCPSCGNPKLAFLGTGTQRAEDELKELLPQSHVVRMDMDTTGGKYSHDDILRSFREGKTDVLIGTQMVTKGHDFPKVTLVGVVNADASMYQDDFRAGERTFDMITQVIGRAGRGQDPGIAVVQTMNPGNDVIELAARQDYEAFYEREIRIRQALTYPPFCDIAVLTMTSEDETELSRAALTLLDKMKQTLSGDAYKNVPMVIFGPFEAPIYKVQNRYRLRLVVKCKLNRTSRSFFASLLREYGRSSDSKRTLGIDFNPSSVG